MPTSISLLGRAGAGLVGLGLLAGCSSAPPAAEASLEDPLASADPATGADYRRDQAVADLMEGTTIPVETAECIVDAVGQSLGLEILSSPEAVTPENEAALVAITNACLDG
ncbi:MAG: hypothetical protein GY929_06080 [Actinomycetia bacterium]|nr:hypothetical protein [Actinomycetes bacterium]